jgi:hypothetical protein
MRGKEDDAAAGVEVDSSVKFPAGNAGQSSHAAEIAFPDGGGRLDLDPGDPAFAVLARSRCLLAAGLRSEQPDCLDAGVLLQHLDHCIQQTLVQHPSIVARASAAR